VVTVALELGLVALIGLPPGWSAPAPALAAGVPAGADCDNDAASEPNGDPDEVQECLPVQPPAAAVEDEEKVLGGALAGLAADGMLYAGGLLAADATAGFITVGVFVGITTVAVPIAAVGLGLLAVSTLMLGIAADVLYDPASSAQAVALPEPISLGAAHLRNGVCRRGPHRAACLRVVSAARRYLASAEAAMPSLEALATSISRFAAAKREGLGDVAVAQAAAVSVYAAAARQGLEALHGAAVGWASALTAAHADLRVVRPRARKEIKHLEALQGVPRSVIRRLQTRLGYSRAELKAAVTTGFRQAKLGGARSLRSFLKAPLPNLGSLVSRSQSLGISQAGYLVQDMSSNGEISQSAGAALASSLLEADRACTPAERTQPINQFLEIATQQLSGGAREVMKAAAVPLLGNHPYPGNTPPTAGFRASPSSQTIGSSGHAHVAFFDESADKGDGGHVGCHRWDFGDGTTSSEVNPTHDYTSPGTYAVALRVADDDGFAQATVTHTVTITH